MTSKGQLTLPKEIRDRLKLDAGAILDFQVQPTTRSPPGTSSPTPGESGACSSLRTPRRSRSNKWTRPWPNTCAASMHLARRAANRLADDRHRHQHPAAPLAQR
ncbi:MAG: AbrB/MazE/SpoVT family DNA-binding domain-containing protein [Rubrivivax sp.]|nr:AbrB/MazE/SpoVT family DNA-binding domain-containing protein [Rubrivivax sp.]